MNFLAPKFQDSTVLVFSSPDSETAADFIDRSNLAGTLARVTKILAAAVNVDRPSFDAIQDPSIVSWASSKSGNFIWLASFAQHLNLRHFAELGDFHESYETLSLLSQRVDSIRIGDFSHITNSAYSKPHGLDFRHLANPYVAYQLLAQAISTKSAI